MYVRVHRKSLSPIRTHFHEGGTCHWWRDNNLENKIQKVCSKWWEWEQHFLLTLALMRTHNVTTRIIWLICWGYSITVYSLRPAPAGPISQVRIEAQGLKFSTPSKQTKHLKDSGKDNLCNQTENNHITLIHPALCRIGSGKFSEMQICL